MKALKFLALGVGAVGVGIGYLFHDEIEEFIDSTLDKVLDKVDGDKCKCNCGCDEEEDEWDMDVEDLDDDISLNKAPDNFFEDETSTEAHENVVGEVHYDTEKNPHRYVVLE